MNEINPLVTVNILSFNRKDELRNTLQKVYGQNYKNIEVIVVDNNSADASAEMVKLEFPSTKIIILEKNIGIAGWNEGFKIAKGDYVLVLDDDSYPEENAIDEGIKCFEKDDKIGIVALNIQNIRYDICESAILEKKVFTFIGCGAIIRKNIFDKIGCYNTLYFLYHNELDFSARCLNEGYKIIYCNNSKVIHTMSSTSRDDRMISHIKSPFRYYHNFISFSIFILQNLSLKTALTNELKWIINRAIVAFFYPVKKEFFLGLKKLIVISPGIIKSRKVLKEEVQTLYSSFVPFVDREYFPFFKKRKIKLWKKFQ